MRRICLLIFVAALSACQTSQDYGSGPIELSANATALFEKYKLEQFPLHFAVSVDGRHARYFYCPNSLNCNYDHTKAITYCQGGSNGVPCKIFALGHSIVWDGPVRFAASSSGPATASAPPQEPAPMVKRTFALEWEGKPELLVGSIEIDEKSGHARTALSDGSGTCTGRYQFGNSPNGTWSMACSNGDAASGVIESKGSGKGWVGSGTDTKGRKIRFTIRAD